MTEKSVVELLRQNKRISKYRYPSVRPQDLKTLGDLTRTLYKPLISPNVGPLSTAPLREIAFDSASVFRLRPSPAARLSAPASPLALVLPI